MILLIAVIAGLIAGLIRSWIRKENYRTISLRLTWLVFLAFIPQLLAFNIPFTQPLIPDNWIPFILLTSQAALFIFVWANRKKPGMWLMGLGLICNFLVIALNGGFMPLSPETFQKLVPAGMEVDMIFGERIGYGKDILLAREDTTLWFLSDIFTLPKWINYRVAYSIGDVFISLGAFLLLWSLGGSSPNNIKEVRNAKGI